ncbi:MAG: Stp1/IreP family PP2C-type Ser/Thr phosphatase [Gaiellaceae bacterium]
MRLGRATGLTDTGRKRRHNEDSYVLLPPLFAVADGMGGAQAGEIASRLAAETVRDEEADAGAGLERVSALVQSANRRVYERSRRDTSASGMGTTMTIALVENGIVSIGHVGDSRAYLLRDGALEQLTEDHSLVAELQRSGKLTAEEAEHHPQRSVITRALGTDPDVDVDTYTVEPRSGDIFMLCSDGLTSMVGDEAIRRIVEEHRDDLDAAARALIAAANLGGGEDNITVVFFDIADTAAESAETLEQPVVPVEDEAKPLEDEDTLSGIERVPAVDTMVVSPEEMRELLRREQPAEGQPVEEQEPPEAGARPRRGRRVLAALAVLVLLTGLAALLVWGLTR